MVVFPKDFLEAFQTSFDLLKLVNLRYTRVHDQPLWKKCFCFSNIFIAVFIHTLQLCIHLPALVMSGNMSTIGYFIPCLLFTIHAILQSVVLIPKTSQLSAFIKELGSLWRKEFNERQKKQKDAILWQLNFINKACCRINVFGASAFFLSPYFETVFRRLILRQDSELLLPFKANYPFNPTKNWLIYTVVYILQLYPMSFITGMYTGAKLIMVTSCALLATEFLMLKEDLNKPERKKKIEENETQGNNEELGLKAYVKKHQDLLRLSRQLDSIFNGIVFVDLSFAGITTCAFGFMALFNRSPSYMLISYLGIACSMLAVLYFCYYGELLTRASSSIGDTAYETVWYDGGKDYKRAILLIMIISQKPCCLTSLRYAEVSLNMFSKVVSSTWSYFSVINSLYSEE